MFGSEGEGSYLWGYYSYQSKFRWKKYSNFCTFGRGSPNYEFTFHVIIVHHVSYAVRKIIMCVSLVLY